MCVCVSVLQQKQFEEAVQQVNNQGIVYAEIKHEVKEWIKLAVESEEGLHQELRQAHLHRCWLTVQTVLDN